MMGWMLLFCANLIAKDPTAVLPPYITKGIEVVAGVQGHGRQARDIIPQLR